MRGVILLRGSFYPPTPVLVHFYNPVPEGIIPNSGAGTVDTAFLFTTIIIILIKISSNSIHTGFLRAPSKKQNVYQSVAIHLKYALLVD